ncbi:MAG: hypothetical protein H7A06_04030 [Pseudomonadales bacterium]|nr:hypothetical protein [Pseudomonadales bacterium]
MLRALTVGVLCFLSTLAPAQIPDATVQEEVRRPTVEEQIQEIMSIVRSLQEQSPADVSTQQDRVLELRLQEQSLNIAQMDLQQQQAMALYARRTFWLAVAATVFSLATIVGLFITILQARVQRMQDRAWVIFSHRERDSEHAPNAWVHDRYYWTNFGKTPALKVRIALETQSIPIDEAAHDLPVFRISGPLEEIGFVGPSCSIPGGLELSWDVFEALTKKTHRVFIHTRIEYETIYGKKCVTEQLEELKCTMFAPGDEGNGRAEVHIQPIGNQSKAT